MRQAWDVPGPPLLQASVPGAVAFTLPGTVSQLFKLVRLNRGDLT